MANDHRYNEVFENNKKWAESKKDEDVDFFTNLAKGQNPDFLFIGCSDSRVPASKIMGFEPGDVFVHRNIANLVVSNDVNVHSVLQYAVEYLEVKHVIVCGHYGCGGIRSALQQEDFGFLNLWLRNIRDVYRLHQDELDALGEDEKLNRLVELNVIEQCVNLTKTEFVQKSYNQKGYPIVNGWVYDMNNGILKDLMVDFPKILDKIKETYRLE